MLEPNISIHHNQHNSQPLTQAKARRTKEKIAKEKVKIERYRECFSSDAGLYVLADLRKTADKPSYVPGMSFDQTAYNEGVKAILRAITHNLDDNRLELLQKIEQEI